MGDFFMGAGTEYGGNKKKNDKKVEILEKIADDIEKNINKPAKIKKIIKKLRLNVRQIKI